MRRWKRVVLGLCLVLAAAAALILWDKRGGRTPSVSISFLGYTNRTLIRDDDSSNALLATFRASNAGPVAVKFSSLRAFGPSTNDVVKFFRMMTSSGILEPGKTFDIEIYALPKIDFLAGDVDFSRWGVKERTGWWIWNHGNATIQRWAAQTVFSHLEITTIQFGVTNQPPASGTLNR